MDVAVSNLLCGAELSAMFLPSGFARVHPLMNRSSLKGLWQCVHRQVVCTSERLTVEDTSADAVARSCESAAWKLLLKGCQLSGPAAIKWAQWSACRPDVFPPDLCDILSQMHEDAPLHKWKQTAEELQAAFGRDLEDLFVAIDRQPVASGSIAQVCLPAAAHTPACAQI